MYVTLVSRVTTASPASSTACRSTSRADDDGTATQRLLKMPAKNVPFESACAALLARLRANFAADGGGHPSGVRVVFPTPLLRSMSAEHPEQAPQHAARRQCDAAALLVMIMVEY